MHHEHRGGCAQVPPFTQMISRKSKHTPAPRTGHEGWRNLSDLRAHELASMRLADPAHPLPPIPRAQLLLVLSRTSHATGTALAGWALAREAAAIFAANHHHRHWVEARLAEARSLAVAGYASIAINRLEAMRHELAIAKSMVRERSAVLIDCWLGVGDTRRACEIALQSSEPACDEPQSDSTCADLMLAQARAYISRRLASHSGLVADGEPRRVLDPEASELEHRELNKVLSRLRSMSLNDMARLRLRMLILLEEGLAQGSAAAKGQMFALAVEATGHSTLLAAEIMLAYGRVCRQAGAPEDGLRAYRRAADLAQQHGLGQVHREALTLLAAEAAADGQHDIAYTALVELRRLERSTQTPPLPAEELSTAGSVDPALVGPPYLEAALSCINARLRERLTVQEIAAAAGVARRTLELAFARIVGMTIKEYQRNQRLAAMAQLLHTTDRSIGDIAADFSYTNSSVMARDFKAQFGATPTEIRRSRWKDWRTGPPPEPASRGTDDGSTSG